MKQVLIIHGGNSYNSYREYRENLEGMVLDYERLKYSPSWRSWIAEQLTDYDVLTPNFPNGHNAQYDEWVIYFEKILPLLHDNFSLVGHSLGAMFLAKYLHTNVLANSADKIILIAGRYGVGEHDPGTFLVRSAKGLDTSAQEIHLFHSEDDPVAEYDSLDHFNADLPSAVVHSFKNRKHFNGATFPELLAILKQQ